MTLYSYFSRIFFLSCLHTCWNYFLCISAEFVLAFSSLSFTYPSFLFFHVISIHHLSFSPFTLPSYLSMISTTILYPSTLHHVLFLSSHTPLIFHLPSVGSTGARSSRTGVLHQPRRLPIPRSLSRSHAERGTNVGRPSPHRPEGYDGGAPLRNTSLKGRFLKQHRLSYDNLSGTKLKVFKEVILYGFRPQGGWQRYDFSE